MMKTNVFTFIFLMCISIGYTQECNSYYPLVEGIKAQVTSYDKKGKTAAIVDYQIVDVRIDNGQKIANISSTVKDEKGKPIADSSYEVSCSGDVISIDFKSLISPQLLDQYKNLDFEITGTDIEIPNNLNVGDKLPDSNMEMIMNMGGMNMTMNIAMKNRMVTGQEKITTPAGNFNCYVISYNTEFNMGMPHKGTAKQWLSNGVGMVKQEDYNGNGKLTGSSMLTAFSK